MEDKTKEPFPNAFRVGDIDGLLPPPRTLTELCMVKLSASIRTKPEWWIKYKNSEIRAKWKAEALATKMVWIEKATMLVPFDGAREQYFGEDEDTDFDDSVVTLTEKQIEYVLAELDGYAKLRDKKNGVQVSCFDGVWQSDTLVNSDLRSRLLEEVAILEDLPENEKDWHPGSNNQVLDLVHPSLYCVVYGKTLAHPINNDPSKWSSDDLRVISKPGGSGPFLSEKFQWLPTDFSISADGSVKALGYINNLHPSRVQLYGCIENVLSSYIPMFEKVLTDMLNPLPIRIPDSYKPISEFDPDYPKKPSDYKARDEDGLDYWDRLQHYEEEIWPQKKLVGLPDTPEQGYTGGLEHRSLYVSLRGRTVQVIVKLANIHLTPEKPEYKGGSWHVEGMANEHIVASGIYYYDQENISSSELAFRIAVDEPEPARNIQGETYDYHAHYKTWGMVMRYAESTKLNNVVGAVDTCKDRCIAFPNTYQHRVSGFRLTDPTKSGYRKILALFLVDPNIDPIPSTTHVPPQQLSWTMQALGENNSSSLLQKLPAEIFGIIESQADMMNDKEARELRLELMEERTTASEEDDEDYNIFSRVFNLCEH